MTFDPQPPKLDIDPAADLVPTAEALRGRAWTPPDGDEIDGTLCDVPLSDNLEPHAVSSRHR